MTTSKLASIDNRSKESDGGERLHSCLHEHPPGRELRDMRHYRSPGGLHSGLGTLGYVILLQLIVSNIEYRG